MSAEVAGGVSLILIGLQVEGLLGYWFRTSGLTLGVAIPPASARLQLSKHQKIQKVKDMFKLSQFPFFIVLSQKFYQEISLLFHWLDLKEINAGEPGKYSPIHLHTNARIH